MYRIRFHGRGGQGMKTASRLLGQAFFQEGFEVQDAPRYGAERRGAPIFAYVRASRAAIRERGVIRQPDLVFVADDTLVAIPGAEVLTGVTAHTVLLISSARPGTSWRERLNFPGPVLTLPEAEAGADYHARRTMGAAGAGAAARLTGVISREALARAIRIELAHLGEALLAMNFDRARWAYDLMAAHSGSVTEAPEPTAAGYQTPRWLALPLDAAGDAAPAIMTPATTELIPTGLWRSLRPVIDYSRCKRCAWLCSTLCPDSVISVDAQGYPRIDYQHCKGCLICMAQCPSHAIHAIPEEEAAASNS
jgi:pyruvate ferredoxin oxidoreductase gamma subunit